MAGAEQHGGALAARTVENVAGAAGDDGGNGARREQRARDTLRAAHAAGDNDNGDHAGTPVPRAPHNVFVRPTDYCMCGAAVKDGDNGDARRNIDDDGNGRDDRCGNAPDDGAREHGAVGRHDDTDSSCRRAGACAQRARPREPCACQTWTNRFSLPVEYTVATTSDLLDPRNPTLARVHMPANLNRRVCVVDATVYEYYGERLDAYFDHHSVERHVLALPGGEENKTIDAVERVLDALCDFKLHRREPVIAIGGGVILDIVGFAASMYRRGVPYIRVPTTLLAIVDASVGVKTGVDYVSRRRQAWERRRRRRRQQQQQQQQRAVDQNGSAATDSVVESDPISATSPTSPPSPPKQRIYKNRVGAFYAPLAAWLDKSFVATQDERNIVNGLGEVVKLALVRSPELYHLLRVHGAALIDNKFQGERAAVRTGRESRNGGGGGGGDGDHGVDADAPVGSAATADRVIELSIQIMLEELGPNLWEARLERCVDYGHTFSKILEMEKWGTLLHGEAVNIDGFFCVLLSEQRGWLTASQRRHIQSVMHDRCRLPVHDPLCDDVDVMWRGVLDAVEHRNGSQRIPLVHSDVGRSVCVDNITRDEVARACRTLRRIVDNDDDEASANGAEYEQDANKGEALKKEEAGNDEEEEEEEEEEESEESEESEETEETEETKKKTTNKRTRREHSTSGETVDAVDSGVDTKIRGHMDAKQTKQRLHSGNGVCGGVRGDIAVNYDDDNK